MFWHNMYGSMETEKFIVASQCMYWDATDMINLWKDLYKFDFYMLCTKNSHPLYLSRKTPR